MEPFTGPVVVFCSIMLLMAQNVHSYPYRVAEKPKNAVQRSLHTIDDSQTGSTLRFPRNSKFQVPDEIKRLFKVYRNGEQLDFEERSTSERGSNRKVLRDTSGYLDDRTPSKTSEPNISTRQLSKGLFRHREGSQEMQSDGKIVFPGDDHREPDLTKSVPVCKGSTYCESVDSYPEHLVNNAIKRNGSLKLLSSVDMLSDVAQRIDVTDDVPLCVSTEQVIYPKSGETKNMQWLFIVNQDNLKQGVRTETCIRQNSRCSVIGGSAEGYNTTCKQKYIYRQLAALSPNGTVISDTFRIPSSCCCHVSFTGSPLTRMGVNIVDQRSQMTPAETRKRK